MKQQTVRPLSSAAVSAISLNSFGLSAIRGYEGQPAHPLTTGFTKVSFGEKQASGRILVAYASKNGSTGGVAELIGKTLAECGAAVEVLPLGSVESVAGYQAVVLGSAINGGKWLPEATAFVQKHQQALRQLPTAYFMVCMMQANQARWGMVSQFLAAERALVSPVAEGRFVGAFFTNHASLFEKIGVRFFVAYCGLGFRTGDFREPEKIRAWALSLHPLLVGAGS